MSDTTFARTFPSDRLQATAANTPRRTMHGSGGWTLPSQFGALRQPQDGALTSGITNGTSSIRPIDGRSYTSVMEADDARLNGSLRSLACRVKGLNVRPALPSDLTQLDTPAMEVSLKKVPEASGKTASARTQVA
ncbi:hypothetical protein [Granulicella paludicola]|uniref:hypothetical protein n=1 Tax=Granulicella paludicola TaxID=474951 RepID=UPI0021E01483|nr:hypothetical protein [Granulicella paludicola]